MSRNALSDAPDSNVKRPRPTGIEVLDETLDGGLRAGSIVALLAAPASQSELLLSELTRERKTLYLTFQRAPAAVNDSLECTGADMDTTRVTAVDPDKPLDEAYTHIQSLDEEATVIIDPTTVIEEFESQRLVTFLNAMKTHLTDIGGLAFLHCLDRDTLPANRGTTKYMADVVFTLETEFYGDRIDNRLLVSKNRGGRALTEALKLELTDTVLIDTSRQIA